MEAGVLPTKHYILDQNDNANYSKNQFDKDERAKRSIATGRVPHERNIKMECTENQLPVGIGLLAPKHNENATIKALTQ